MSDDSFYKINQHHRECVEGSLHWGLVCLLKLLEMHKTEFIPVAYHIFNKKKTYYKGTCMRAWVIDPTSRTPTHLFVVYIT